MSVNFLNHFFKLLFLLFIFNLSLFADCDTGGKVLTLDLNMAGTSDKPIKYWDAEESNNSEVKHDSSGLEMMYDYTNLQKGVGIVFTKVDIPQGCYVKNAYIQFTSKHTDKKDTSLIIYGEDEDNATDYHKDRSITNANRTDNNATWKKIKDWKKDQSDKDTRTPNISCLVEPVLGRKGWEDNNSMGFIILRGDGCDNDGCSRKAYSGDNDNDTVPMLHIEYSDNSNDSRPCSIVADDSYDVRMGETTTLKVTDNDVNNLDDNSISIRTKPSHGTYKLNGNDVIYTPNDGYKGDDNLTYTVTLDGIESNEAFVALHIGLKGGDVDFHIVNPPETRNVQGNYFMGGNMSLCVSDNNAEDGECKSQKGTNDAYMKYIDIDNDANTYNSSAFTLNLPDNSKIVWAGLYWGGFIHNTKDSSSDSDKDWQFEDIIKDAKKYDNGPGLDLKDDTYDTDHVKFKDPKSDDYIDVNATSVYFSKYGYSGFADITYIFDDNDDLKNNPNGEYILANLSTNHKKMYTHGNSGGWNLVVIYENPDAEYKNVTVYDGWKEVDPAHPVDINVSGFLIPESKNVKAKLSFNSFDGDGGKCHFKLNDVKLGIWKDEAGHTHDDREEVFNSTIVGVPQKRPDFNLTDNINDYYSSFELDTYDASNILQSGDTSANIKMDMGQGAEYETSMLIFSADMYTPKFCYDYNYKQDNVYFTEENNGSKLPRIVGKINSDKPVDVEVYLRNNEDSDLQAVDFTVDIKDINDSQAKYKRESTWVTQANSTKRVAIADVDLNVSDTYDKNISINDINSKDYFYVGYSLTPKDDLSDINISLTGYAKYNLMVDNKKIILPRIKIGDQKRIPICSDSNEYKPVKGLFNIVHNNYYDNSHGDKYYNIPTQVTSRAANLSLISLKKDSEDLENRTTIVGVEMLNAASFHDTQASCSDINNSLGQRVWVTLDNNVSKIAFNKDVVDSSFYAKANKDTAFRVVYNTDENGTAIELKNDGNNYIIQDYNDTIEPNDDDCLNGNGKKVVDECGEKDNSISKEKLIGCMQCIFGRRSASVCSRDNFSLRPEALLLKIDDQNQSNSTQKSRIADDVSGVKNPSGAKLQIASGYNYLLELNATNHKGNDKSLGYNNTVDVNLTWNSTKTGCNDDSNRSYSLGFYDGYSEKNVSNNHIGEYILSATDKTWTAVDVNASHHLTDGNFTTSNDNYDCIKESEAVAKEGDSGNNNTPQNGCLISSDHNNSEADLKYRDYNIQYHPYKFALSSTVTLPTGKDFLYMNDIFEDKNMSVKMKLNITAEGYNGVANVNFVKACYSEPLTLAINKTRTTTGGTKFEYTFYNYTQEDNESSIISADEKNDTLANADTLIEFNTTADSFAKENNGTIYTNTYLNFDRNVSKAVNPQDLNFTSLKVESAETFNADLANDKNATSNLNINNGRVLFYYGLAHAPKQRYSVPEDANYTAKIYYEVYCYGNDCNTSLLKSTEHVDDMRWYKNTDHNTSNDGNVSAVFEKDSAGKVTPNSLSNASNLTTVNLPYDGSYGYPYSTTMELNASKWLIYSEHDENATSNSFQAEYNKASTGWSGKHETNAETNTTGSAKTNRRIMW